MRTPSSASCTSFASRAESEIAESEIQDKDLVLRAVPSARTIVYKGLAAGAAESRMFYVELADPDVDECTVSSASEISTNTFPSWQLAHPYRYVAHNGEINTLKGNVNWMRARQSSLRSHCSGMTSRS